MVIGVISDTHGNLEGWERAWDLGLGEADVIFHCGDVLYHGPKFTPAKAYAPRDLAAALNACSRPVLIARGNADSDVDQVVLDMPIQQPQVLAVLDGMRIVAAHGHVMGPAELLALADRWRLDFVLTGHTHAPVIEKVGRTYHLNPGSVTYPLAKEPQLQVPTFGLIRDGGPEVVDLGTGRALLHG